MTVQSTPHIMMIEPAVFYTNEQTMASNHYQVIQQETHDETQRRALHEFRTYRDLMIENGVAVTTVLGHPDCPDHIFPNWISTHANRQMVVYPMLNDNRRKEKTPEILGVLNQSYDVVLDLSRYESEGRALESTGSLCIDRVNKIVYAALSPRTDEALVKLWAAEMGFKPVIFNTASHTGKPVYHTDLILFIGTNIAGICSPCILDTDRARVLGQLRETHQVVEFTMDQLKTFCGNSLELIGTAGRPHLAMSTAAHQSLSPAQRETLDNNFANLILGQIPTIELYGGGSARCMIMELF